MTIPCIYLIGCVATLLLLWCFDPSVNFCTALVIALLWFVFWSLLFVTGLFAVFNVKFDINSADQSFGARRCPVKGFTGFSVILFAVEFRFWKAKSHGKED